MSKKVTSIVLALCMLLSGLTVCSFSTNAAVVDEPAVSASTGAQSDVQGSAVLHCFNWSYNSIKANLQAIKDAGYTAVQTSPVQAPKDFSATWSDQSGQWWKLYQPISISIADGNTWLGTKAELKSLCDAAEDMGIKVIVDIVANHLGNVDGSLGNTMSNVSPQVDSKWRSNSAYWHINGDWANDDNNRYTMTVGSIGLPDLNTGNSEVQNAYKSLLIDCINQGVDGFRFDAAKHIELPNDSGNSSQFWPTVINGSQSSTSNDIYYYGEILNGCGTSISGYTQYMSITDNYSSDSILVAANNGNASGMANSNYSKGAGANKSVLWVESHDTYMGESGSAGIKNTASISDGTIIKAWAMVGSRANATSLFFARPAASMGSASTNTTWKSTAVAEINKFKNYFDGETEYLSSEGSIAYNERGTKGVVLVNCSGTSTSVNVTAKKMAAGTYKDAITGSTFTVANGKISGQIGSTGVAVVYNAEPEGPSASVTPGSQTYKTDTLSLTLKYSNATSGQYSIDGGAYQSFTNGQTITIGSGLAYGTTTTVSVKASNGSTTSDAVSYTYTKADPSLTQKVYFDNSSYGWSSVYAYIYLDENTQNAAWPGVQMTLDSSTGYYVVEVPESLANGLVIFTENSTATTNRYPADMEDGVALNGNTMLLKANHQWVEYSPVVPTTTKAPATTVVTQPTTTTPPQNKVLIGDVNLSGSISISDATEIQMHCVDMITLTGDNATAADVNKDGTVNIKDATAIQCYLVDLTDQSYYCGQYTDGTTPVDPTTQPTTVKPTTTQPVTQPVTQPTTQPAGNYIYYKNTNSWSTVKAYYWSDANTAMTTWPGVSMESVGNSTYRVEVPADAQYIIFNNGSGTKTDDLKIPGMNQIYNNGSWSPYTGGGDVTQPTTGGGSTTGTTVTFTNSLNWNGTICCYYWPTGSAGPVAWPGSAMTSAGTNDFGQAVYTFDVPAGNDNIIFTNGSSQTVDIKLDGSATRFYAESTMSGSGYTVGTW